MHDLDHNCLIAIKHTEMKNLNWMDKVITFLEKCPENSSIISDSLHNLITGKFKFSFQLDFSFEEIQTIEEKEFLNQTLPEDFFDTSDEVYGLTENN